MMAEMTRRWILGAAILREIFEYIESIFNLEILLSTALY
ncbi:Hypothetical protein Cul131001_2124 [Corynebacterium ulcerans]|uniref:Uncharacterized protein n=1 Tax=Corynebacterium ulcerans FRC58 TaxID=1408268 RepID=A0ABN4H335_CORUL|nr:Hypothetical protein CulFRC58_2109 [Corynebacterium ulcerans FRC58]ALD95797.1 Hypothetical protein Cul131001_2124 [Corynebacterium ulcerans]